MQVFGHLGVHHHTAVEAFIHLLLGNWPITLPLSLIVTIAAFKLARN